MTAHLSPPETDGPSDALDDGTEERRSTTARSRSNETGAAVETETLLDVLGDEYACDIIRALGSGPKPAKDLIDGLGMSRPTVYRRLDRLTEAGLVDSQLRPARDGHHRQEFRLVVDEIELQVGEHGIDGHVRAAPADD